MPVCSAVSWRIKWRVYWTILLIMVFGFMPCAMPIYVILLVKKKSRSPYLMLLSFGKKFPRVSYKDLAQATGNFLESNLIGRGSYGSVYRGKLTKAKMEVAIKVFDLDMGFADSSFVSECEALRIVRHRNLLPILTACSTIDNREGMLSTVINILLDDDMNAHIGDFGIASLVDDSRTTAVGAFRFQ
ncbi:hypothetical protein GQ55_1G300300 [Panicum hallii var. hallii]|uniref:Protein kinase domain-containing protein n=1 Tax=Panicum hallii var. hallii TaxID=1504633 RepID=A0A2T7F916_9POAL|nr:hypothetical protein GQ55_1G300300 [Panicum hallii var. hallii]